MAVSPSPSPSLTLTPKPESTETNETPLIMNSQPAPADPNSPSIPFPNNNNNNNPQFPSFTPPPSFRPINTPSFPHPPQFTPINPQNPNFHVQVQPPGVAGSVTVSLRPPGGVTYYQNNPNMMMTMQYAGQMPNGYSPIPPPGIPRYPTTYTPMVRPAYPPRMPGAIGMLQPLVRPPIPGIYVMTETDQCYCVILNAHDGAAFPTDNQVPSCSSNKTGLRIETDFGRLKDF